MVGDPPCPHPARRYRRVSFFVSHLSALCPPPCPARPGVRLLRLSPLLVVADKPAGLLCVPGRGPDRADCLATRVAALVPDALVVHRLDMATSGLVAFGRGAAMQRWLSMAFAARQVHKRYEAVVQGLPAE